MENDNKKIITVSFAVAALLAAYVSNVIIDTLKVTVGFLAQLLSGDLVTHGVPVVVGLGVFIALQFNKKVVQGADEVVVEIRKVVWPSRKDTTAMTIVVCVMVLISGVAFGVFDIVSSYVVNLMVLVR